jgi:hypothetical protein
VTGSHEAVKAALESLGNEVSAEIIGGGVGAISEVILAARRKVLSLVLTRPFNRRSSGGGVSMLKPRIIMNLLMM